MSPASTPLASPEPNGVVSDEATTTPAAPTSQASLKSTPKPKMRRKVSVEDALATSTAVQRLVEYFVVVSSQPRWETSPQLQTPEPKNRKKPVDATPKPEEPQEPKTEKKPIVFETPRHPQRQTTNIDPNNLMSPEPLNPPTTKKKPKPLAERFRFRTRAQEEVDLRPSSSEDDEKKEVEEGYPDFSSPTPRSEWTREDGPTENIHMPTQNSNHSFQPMITARFPYVDHKGTILL